MNALAALVQRIVRDGDLAIVAPDGRRHRFGNGTGATVAFSIADKATVRRLTLDPQLALGEGYMTGRIEMVQGSIYDLVALLARNLGVRPMPLWASAFDRARYVLRRASQFNPVGRAARNVAHHYDIDGAIYDLFLDSDRQYSCAYFTPGADLEQAQTAKKKHIAAKLAIKPKHRVLDVGSGWGGLGLYLATSTGAGVTGITLSHEQLKYARQNAVARGLTGRVAFEYADYREVTGSYDRIVSVGMFEHVGVTHYDAFFARIARLLDKDGVCLLHFIGRADVPTATNPFIARHIFPGGYIPALSEVLPAIERSGLILSDVEVLRLHYAETLRAWRERFRSRWAQAVARRGEEFARMWEFYLAGSEAAFRYQNLVVFQIQLVHRIATLPMTRDYMYEAEQRLRLAG